VVPALGGAHTPDAGLGIEVGAEVVISPSLFWGASDVAPDERYEILGSPTNGTHAEYVAVPAANVYPKPGHLDWSEAAALPLAGMTAWRALVTRGGLTAGEKVIVGAASSGVGSMAIQIAAASGAKVVAVTSGEEKAEYARKLGASDVVDRTCATFSDDLTTMAGGADLALDPTGALWQPFVDALAPGGRLVVVGKMAAPAATLRVQSVYWKQVDVRGSSMGSPRDFAGLLDHVARGRWAPLIDSEFPLDDIASAYARLDEQDRVGKVVLRPWSP
jgi:NADPH:quinone reductase-like Zn-dependent oxidoreductase